MASQSLEPLTSPLPPNYITRECKGLHTTEGKLEGCETEDGKGMADTLFYLPPPTTFPRCGQVHNTICYLALPSFLPCLIPNFPKSSFDIVPGIISSNKTLAPELCLKFCFVGDWANISGLDAKYGKHHLFIL